MRAKKYQKHCEGCRRDEGARFRTWVNLHLCADCFTAFLRGGKIPAPIVEVPDAAFERAERHGRRQWTDEPFFAEQE